VVQEIEKNDARFVAFWELNLSCPNVKEGGLHFCREDRLVRAIVSGVKKVTGRPIFVKLSVQSEYLKVAEMSLKVGAAGFSMINTLPAMVFDLKTGKPKLGAVTGGLSGPVIKPVALAAVYQTWQRFKRPIIASGGISTAEDCREFFLAGAALAAVGTANFVEPACALTIIRDLKKG
jgi:dihydroorotate dehydrogenase (NAD+) catalytic subunit